MNYLSTINSVRACLSWAGEQDRGDHLERNCNCPPKHRGVAKFTGADFGNRELAFLKLLLHGVDQGGMAANFPFQQNEARVQDKRQVHDNIRNDAGPVLDDLFGAGVPGQTLQAIGWILPITHSLNGFRAAAAGVPLSGVASDAIWLLVASLILMPFSLWIFAKSVGKARVDGTLSMY